MCCEEQRAERRVQCAWCGEVRGELCGHRAGIEALQAEHHGDQREDDKDSF